MRPIGFFFLAGGIGLAVISQLDSVTGFLDSNSTADSDPAGGVLLMIGLIWAAVGAFLMVVPLLGRVPWPRLGSGSPPPSDEPTPSPPVHRSDTPPGER